MIAMMRSPSSGRAKMTPMVLRAVGRTSEALTWTSLPDSVMTMTSSSGRTTRAPTRAAAFVDELADAHAEGAARLGRVFLDGGALGVAGFGDDQQVGVLARDLHAEELVVAAELHAAHAGGGAAHGAQLLVGGGEAHGLAVAGDEDEVLVGHDGLCGDELVGLAVLVLAQVDGDDAAGAGRVVQAQRGLLDEAALGGQDQEVCVLVGADREDLCDVLVGLEGQQVGDVLALGVTTPSGIS